MRIAIIGGSGKMGRWFASFLLKEGKEVILIGRNKERLLEVKQQLGVEVSTGMEAVSTADLVVISVPVDSFEEVVRRLQPHLNPEQNIIDVTSVKVTPVAGVLRGRMDPSFSATMTMVEQA